MLLSCSSLTCQSYECCAYAGWPRAAQAMRHRAKSSEANPMHRVLTVERMWDDPKLPRSSPKRPAKTVADMWDGPELLKPNPAKLLVLRTSGMAQRYSILAHRSHMCSWSRAAQVLSVKATHGAHMPDAPSEDCRRHVELSIICLLYTSPSPRD